MDQSSTGLTQKLVSQALAIDYVGLPAAAKKLARQCLTDWLAVTIAGQGDPLVRRLMDDLIAEGGAPQATVFGQAARLSVYQAALINGTASHALDFDDVNYALMGHPTVPVLPALLALAEAHHLEGDAILAAFVAGYEFENRVGLLVAPGHYARGFHATSTVGALGAAVGCAHLLKLSPAQTAHAVGIAVTQSAGLKSMFGTDCKPLHAGNAARIGAQAARLAARGFISRMDSLECVQGFAATHSPDFNPEAALAEPEGGLHLYANLFKYHASCYETHATIESCRALREQPGFSLESLRSINIRVNPYCDQICNIFAPETGLEAKFSLRQTAAFSLANYDTASAQTFTDETVAVAALSALRDKIVVALDSTVPASQAVVRIEAGSGHITEAHFDASRPMKDLDLQAQRLRTKADSLLKDYLTHDNLSALFQAIEAFDEPGQFEAVLKRCQRV